MTAGTNPGLPTTGTYPGRRYLLHVEYQNQPQAQSVQFEQKTLCRIYRGHLMWCHTVVCQLLICHCLANNSVYNSSFLNHMLTGILYKKQLYIFQFILLKRENSKK